MTRTLRVWAVAVVALAAVTFWIGAYVLVAAALGRIA